ncbi:MAG: M28 family peptidase [Candidatus Moduliflexus flocculans]|nr:M28 family peptidase [Candidatus Moduliflexus flocculans]
MYDPENPDGYAARGAAGVILELPEGSPAQRTGYTGSPPGRLVEPREGPVMLAVSKSAFRRLETAAREGGSPHCKPGPVRGCDRQEPDRGLERRRRKLPAPAGADGALRPHGYGRWTGRTFAGALDNASGAALVVRLAEALAGRNLPADFAVVLTDGEEINLSGSWTLANRPPFPLRGAAVLNLDMVGSGSDLPVSVFFNGDPCQAGARRIRRPRR